MSHGIEIHPVPSTIRPTLRNVNPGSRLDNLLRTRIPNRVGRSLNETFENDNIKNYHIVFPIAEGFENVTFSQHQFKSPKRSKRASIDIVYPQILVVVNYDYFVKVGKDVSKALPYLLNFWNGVDLAYRGLEHPKFRLNIAGFVFAKDNDVLDYMSKNMWTKKNLNVGTALTKMGQFMYTLMDSIPFGSYDVAVTITG